MAEYMRRLMKAVERGAIKQGDIAFASVAHDDWCSIYGGGACNCDPEISVRTERGRLRISADGSATPEMEQ